MAIGLTLVLQGNGLILAVMPPGTAAEEAGAVKEKIEKALTSGTPVSVITGIGEIIDNRPTEERALTSIITRDKSSGRYHRRRIEHTEDGDDRILVDERCQTDQAGRYDVLDGGVPESADDDTLCRFCWPKKS